MFLVGVGREGGASDYAGHGPGVNPILSTKDGRLGYKIVEKANIAAGGA